MAATVSSMFLVPSGSPVAHSAARNATAQPVLDCQATARPSFTEGFWQLAREPTRQSSMGWAHRVTSRSWEHRRRLAVQQTARLPQFAVWEAASHRAAPLLTRRPLIAGT